MLLKITIKSANSVKSKNVGKLTGLTVVDVFACCLFSQEEDSEEGVEEVEEGPDYNYILGLALWCLPSAYTCYNIYLFISIFFNFLVDLFAWRRR